MKHLLFLLSMFLWLNKASFAQTLPAYVPTDSIFAWWSLEANVLDYSNQGHDGSQQLAVPTTDRFGAMNSAYNLGSVGSQISLTTSNDFLGGSDYTISFWFRTQYNGNEQIVLSKRPNCMGGDEQFLEVGIAPNSNTLTFTISGGGFQGFAEFIPGVWNHVAYSREGSLQSLFMNGSLSFSNSGDYFIQPDAWLGVSSVSPCITLFGLNERRYEGDMDDIGIWNRALQVWEIADLYGNYIQPVTTFYFDADEDGYGDPNVIVETDTGAPAGYVINGTDCDDTNTQIFPSAPCDDLNELTANDVFSAACDCIGQPINDGSLHSCGAALIHNPNLTYGTMTDQEGHVYKTIVIGEQEWMAENLKTSLYRNGDTIASGLSDAEWQATTEGTWGYYNNDSIVECPYGKYYNWYAVTDSRHLCPTGWQEPSSADWSTLAQFVNYDGGAIKSTSVEFWGAENVAATNASGFSALPGGYKGTIAEFSDLGQRGYFWTSSLNGPGNAWYWRMYENSTIFEEPNTDLQVGMSVRCVRTANTGLVPGCTDFLACNYNSDATEEDGSCTYVGNACDDLNVFTDSDTLTSECECVGAPIVGCMNPYAFNFNPLATIDNGCQYIVSTDTLVCDQITTPAGPGVDFGLWINGLYPSLSSSDWYRWTGSPNLVFSNNGTAHLVGDVVALNNVSNGWHVDITWEDGQDWGSWSAGGGLYMDQLWINGATHATWNFYKMVPTVSRLDGFGAFEGSALFLSHQPANYAYGSQFGMGANNRNANNGGYGWFFYSGVVNGALVSGHGDFTLEMGCTSIDRLNTNIFVFHDLNGNGAHDDGEPGIANWPVMGNTMSSMMWTNANGNIIVPLDSEQYGFSLINSSEQWVSTTPTFVTVDLSDGPAAVLFGLQALPGEPMGNATLFSGFSEILHCTEGYTSGLYIENTGGQPLSGFLTLNCDTLFTPEGGNFFTTAPIETAPGYALWNIHDFLPGQVELFALHINGPGVEYITQVFNFEYELTLLDPQGNVIYSNSLIVSPMVACSYDPNDLTGFPEDLVAPNDEGYTIEHFIRPDHMVEFRVRFQNTGNLPAEDVDIYLPLNPNMWELSTIAPLMRSADAQMICLHDDGTNIEELEHPLPPGVNPSDLLIFNFDDIYLPDSASDPVGSQGYVYFEMRAKHALNPGDEINEQAFIYFENNPAISTNETYHVIFDCESFTSMIGDNELCEGEPWSFEGTQPYVDEYAWSIGSIEGSDSVFVLDDIVIDPGEYVLHLNTSNVLCAHGENHDITVVVHPNPALLVPLDATVCEGEELVFDAESDGTISWSNDAITGETIIADTSFTVTITALGEGGCTTSAEWSVTVDSLPNAEVTVTGNVLTAVDGSAWQWSVNGVDDVTTQSITAEESGNYQVEITNEFGCSSESEIIVIEDVFVYSWSTPHLYPNPMTNAARLELPQGTFDIALHDITGACVRALPNQQGVVIIDRESLASGVYQVRIAQGAESVSVRMVVE